MIYIKRTVALLLGIVTVFLMCGCQSDKEQTQTAIYFDTVVTLTVYGDNDKIFSKCFNLCEKYDKLFSRTNKDSDVYKINHANGQATEVDGETVKLIKQSLKYCANSDGALDITVAPLVELWGFGNNPSVPKQEDVTEALCKVDYTAVKINKNTVTVPKDYGIDLGAVAKGYIADRLAEIYEKNGCRGIINLGGNIMTVGEKPDGAYTVGIKDPDSTDRSIALVKIPCGAVVTSGTYERCFTEKGKTYHHIISTSTGYPVDSNLVSVTIISDNSTEADALSTAVFVMGINDGKNYIEALGSSTEAVFIEKDGKIILTDGLTRKDNIIAVKNS